MVFAATYRFHEIDGAARKRSLQLFMAWQPPFAFKAHYARADGQGGIAIIEADDPATLFEGISPWTEYFEFDLVPVLPVEESVPVSLRMNEWKDSIG